MIANECAVYQGMPLTSEIVFDAEGVGNVSSSIKRGKATSLNGLTVEHLELCHPCLPMFLAKLYNLMMQVGKVPDSFGLSYTNLLLTVKTSYTSKTLSFNNFSGITISCLLSKLFEYLLLAIYGSHLLASF
jgi:hypothetical protein